LKITFFSWVSFIKDFKQSETTTDKIKSFWGTPEWSPN